MNDSYNINGKDVTFDEFVEHTKKINPKAKWYVCPKNNDQTVPMVSCMFCSFGHMTECHYPNYCDPSVCDHAKEEVS